MGAPGPRIRGADDSDVVAELDRERERAAALLVENQRLERERAQERARRDYVRSYSPPPGPLVPAPVPAVQSEPPGSLRPGREWFAVIIRRTDPKWLGLAVVIALLIWGLGGPQGIADKWAIAWGASARDAKLAELERRIQKREEHDAASYRYNVATRDDEIDFRSRLRQLLERQGVQWDPPEGAPPERALRVTVPLRPRGTVSKGPSLIVDSPMPLPPPVPSSTP
jgi:hypothetical protein